MPRTLLQTVRLPAPPERLYHMYLDSEQHTAFTGSPATITPRHGGSFRAFDGLLTGQILHLEPDQVIVQCWRSVNWTPGAIDSILVLSFWPDPDGAKVDLAHVNIDDPDFDDVSLGWPKYYWEPWRAYLLAHPQH
jgi:activator of HSP90 ATPase